MRTGAALFVLLLVAPVAAAQESRFHAELRKEGGKIRESCGEFQIRKTTGCVITLATATPIHAAIGNLAPKNGFGLGPALVVHFTPSESWGITWNTDAVIAAPSGAWRAGTYVKAIYAAVRVPKPVPPGQGRPAALEIHEYPVLTGVAEITSLPRLTYYGLGSDTPNQASTYGLREAIGGGHVVWPLGPESAIGFLRLAATGEINARDVALRSGGLSDLPQLAAEHTESSAPGLSTQPTTVQFAEGVKIRPMLASGHLALDYSAAIQQYVAADSHYSFRRWIVDLKHEVPLYRTSSGLRAHDFNGPDECAVDPSSSDCPPVSRNRTGTITLRARAIKSQVDGTSVVPFYFQPTLGGSDINGARALASYDDYRFRGPHLLLFQEDVEHSLFGPIGIWAGAEQGTVARQDQRLRDAAFKYSVGAGLTIRAGGFPAGLLAYSTGGPEGNHFIFTFSATLLGGSARPSLW